MANIFPLTGTDLLLKKQLGTGTTSLHDKATYIKEKVDYNKSKLDTIHDSDIPAVQEAVSTVDSVVDAIKDDIEKTGGLAEQVDTAVSNTGDIKDSLGAFTDSTTLYSSLGIDDLEEDTTVVGILNAINENVSDIRTDDIADIKAELGSKGTDGDDIHTKLDTIDTVVDGIASKVGIASHTAATASIYGGVNEVLTQVKSTVANSETLTQRVDTIQNSLTSLSNSVGQIQNNTRTTISLMDEMVIPAADLDVTPAYWIKYDKEGGSETIMASDVTETDEQMTEDGWTYVDESSTETETKSYYLVKLNNFDEHGNMKDATTVTVSASRFVADTNTTVAMTGIFGTFSNGSFVPSSSLSRIGEGRYETYIEVSSDLNDLDLDSISAVFSFTITEDNVPVGSDSGEDAERTLDRVAKFVKTASADWNATSASQLASAATNAALAASRAEANGYELGGIEGLGFDTSSDSLKAISDAVSAAKGGATFVAAEDNLHSINENVQAIAEQVGTDSKNFTLQAKADDLIFAIGDIEGSSFSSEDDNLHAIKEAENSIVEMLEDIQGGGDDTEEGAFNSTNDSLHAIRAALDALAENTAANSTAFKVSSEDVSTSSLEVAAGQTSSDILTLELPEGVVSANIKEIRVFTPVGYSGEYSIKISENVNFSRDDELISLDGLENVSGYGSCRIATDLVFINNDTTQTNKMYLQVSVPTAFSESGTFNVEIRGIVLEYEAEADE